MAHFTVKMAGRIRAILSLSAPLATRYSRIEPRGIMVKGFAARKSSNFNYLQHKFRKSIFAH